jgi:hypothetical protein
MMMVRITNYLAFPLSYIATTRYYLLNAHNDLLGYIQSQFYRLKINEVQRDQVMELSVLKILPCKSQNLNAEQTDFKGLALSTIVGCSFKIRKCACV